VLATRASDAFTAPLLSPIPLFRKKTLRR